MLKLGVALNADEQARLLDYLARTFPPQSQPAAQLIPGATRVSFREWSVATPGAFPHDPLATADGAIWYSESGVTPNTLVRFDPKTGGFQSWPIPSGGGVVRNMMATPDRKGLVLAESGAGKLALVELQ